MKIHIHRRHLSLALALFLLFLAITYWGVVAKFLKAILGAAMPLLIGCVVAYIVNLLLRQYEHLYQRLLPGPKAQRFKRAVGIVLSYLSIIIIVALVIRLVIPEIVSCVRLLITNHGRVINRFISTVQENSSFKDFWKDFDPKHLDWGKISKYVGYGFGGTMKTVMSTASSIVSATTTAVIAFFFSIYLLIYKEMLARQFNRVMDTYCRRIKQPVMHVIRTFDESYSNYIIGQCKDAAILGIACFIGMKLLGMPYASMIGVVTFFGALIPIIGAILGASIGVVLIFAVSPIKALVFLIFIIVLQQFDNRVTYPLVVGKSIGLPSVWVFAAVIVGGGISGILGMMLTVPLFAAIYKLVAEDIQRRHVQVNN
jgi:predicted PurR-regulated permease PerM